ncbi:hypothetical protein Tco_0087896 [Tanacetum coccineum]
MGCNNDVSHWYSHETWFNAYQFSIRPIMRSKMWKRNEHQPPLPPVVMKMPDRPRKEKVKAQPLPKVDKGKKVATSLEPLPKVDKGKTKKKERIAKPQGKNLKFDAQGT